MGDIAGHLLLQLLALNVRLAGIPLPHTEQQDTATYQQTSHSYTNDDDCSLHQSNGLKMYP